MNDNKNNIDIKSQIDRYVEGELTEDEVEELWIELIQKDEYMDYLDTTANLKAITRRRESAEKTSRRQKGWIYAAAAAVLLLFAVMVTMRLGYFNSSATVKPVDTIELDYYRSTDTTAEAGSDDQIIRHALELFNSGQFEEAVTLLNDERSKATDAAWISKLNITIGTLYYNKDKFNDAAYYFKDVINYKDQVDVLTLEKAYWYLGNSYFQMSMLQEAEQAMQRTYELNGAYRRVAKSYLDAMKDALASRS